MGNRTAVDGADHAGEVRGAQRDGEGRQEKGDGEGGREAHATPPSGGCSARGRGRFPGSRVDAHDLRPSPANHRVAAPFHGRFGGGLSGYSGGTAQASNLLPFSPSTRGAPRRSGRVC